MNTKIFESPNKKTRFKIVNDKIALLDQNNEVSCYLSLHSAKELNIIDDEFINVEIRKDQASS